MVDDARKRSLGPGRVESAVSILNAVVGDYLEDTGNDLAIEMGLYRDNTRLSLDTRSLAQVYPRANENVCVLVHGMSGTEGCWEFPEERGVSYGTLFEDELGFTPLFLRYNTGLRISENGRRFDDLLEQLTRVYPHRIEELTLIGHSMGGLLIRSACAYAEDRGHGWIAHLRRAFYLGSPHLGAPLEKFGHLTSRIMGLIDEPVVRLTRKLLNLRSVGVKDLRFANLKDEDWMGQDPDAVREDHRQHVPLREGVAHYVIAGTLTEDPESIIARLFGDAMVRVESATGQPPSTLRSPAFPKENVKILPGLAHMSLAHHRRVFDQMRDWCRAPS